MATVYLWEDEKQHVKHVSIKISHNFYDHYISLNRGYSVTYKFNDEMNISRSFDDDVRDYVKVKQQVNIQGVDEFILYFFKKDKYKELKIATTDFYPYKVMADSLFFSFEKKHQDFETKFWVFLKKKEHGYRISSEYFLAFILDVLKYGIRFKGLHGIFSNKDKGGLSKFTSSVALFLQVKLGFIRYAALSRMINRINSKKSQNQQSDEKEKGINHRSAHLDDDAGCPVAESPAQQDFRNMSAEADDRDQRSQKEKELKLSDITNKKEISEEIIVEVIDQLHESLWTPQEVFNLAKEMSERDDAIKRKNETNRLLQEEKKIKARSSRIKRLIYEFKEWAVEKIKIGFSLSFFDRTLYKSNSEFKYFFYGNQVKVVNKLSLISYFILFFYGGYVYKNIIENTLNNFVYNYDYKIIIASAVLIGFFILFSFLAKLIFNYLYTLIPYFVFVMIPMFIRLSIEGVVFLLFVAASIALIGVVIFAVIYIISLISIGFSRFSENHSVSKNHSTISKQH